MYEHFIIWIAGGLFGFGVIILLVILCLVCTRRLTWVPKYREVSTKSDTNKNISRRLVWKPRNYETINQVVPERIGSEEIEMLMSEVNALRRELEEERAEKDKALNRLSSIVSSRVRDGNPNVVDLNDQNRPGKLGDQYSELYDNQWTDAYNAIDEIKRFSSKEIIKILLHILLQCFEMCKVTADNQMAKIRHKLETIVDIAVKDSKTAVDDMLFRVKVERKLFAARKIPDYQTVKQMLLNIGVAEEDTLNIESVRRFTQECARLCWFMVVQDPPMALLVEPNDNTDECFRPYLTRGKQLLYVVWPTLLLQEGGSCVFKGIAEFGNI